MSGTFFLFLCIFCTSFSDCINRVYTVSVSLAVQSSEWTKRPAKLTAALYLA